MGSLIKIKVGNKIEIIIREDDSDIDIESETEDKIEDETEEEIEEEVEDLSHEITEPAISSKTDFDFKSGKSKQKKGKKEPTKFGESLKKLKKATGLTANDFAALIGIPVASINGYLNKGTEPRTETLEFIAQSLGLSPKQLTGGITDRALKEFKREFDKKQES